MIRPVPLRTAFFVVAAILAGSTALRAAPLTLDGFFRGHLAAEGVVENYKDRTRRPFTMDMQARWEGAVGTLIEDVRFRDGERQHKVWRFEKTGPNRYVGRREDVTRDAEVTEDETGIRMNYKAQTPVPSGGSFNLSFDDKMTLSAPGHVTVTSDISYLLLPVGQITMTIAAAPRP